MNKNFARLLIGSGESSPEIRYLTGISTPDDFICFEYNGNVSALMSKLEIDRARSCAKDGVAVLPEDEYGSSRCEIIRKIAECGHFDGFDVPENFPLGLADKLRASGMEIRPTAANFCPQRLFKSEEEVSAVTHSQRAGEAGFARAVEVLQECSIANDGTLVWQNNALTSEILRAEIDCAILKHGALPTGTICAGGVQSSQPHNSGSGILYANKPIVMDIFPRSAETGYWGDLTRTVVKGTPSDIVKKAYHAVLSARETAKEQIAVGVRTAALHETANAVLEKYRFFTGVNEGSPFGFFHGLGHGVGLEIHEAPRVSPRSDAVLQGGELFTIEPGVYYREWGGIRLEDLIWLAPDGEVHCLTQAPDFLTID